MLKFCLFFWGGGGRGGKWGEGGGGTQDGRLAGRPLISYIHNMIHTYDTCVDQTTDSESCDISKTHKVNGSKSHFQRSMYIMTRMGLLRLCSLKEVRMRRKKKWQELVCVLGKSLPRTFCVKTRRKFAARPQSVL